jgi:hypothetical protein
MAYTPEMGRRFWFEFDNATQSDPEFGSVILRAGGFGVQNDYRQTRMAGTYPAAFQQRFLSRLEDWKIIAKLQTDMIGPLLGNDWSNIQAAFEDFGQGTLFDNDPRRDDGNRIHMMDGQVGAQLVGYHRWHASIRVIQLLGFSDNAWWEQLDGILGLAWAIQSFARPRQQDMPNPRLSDADLTDLRSAWLELAPDRRDRQYDLTNGPVGFHPSPKQPAA